jgi:hypothetical protein
MTSLRSTALASTPSDVAGSNETASLAAKGGSPYCGQDNKVMRQDFTSSAIADSWA